MRLVNGLYSLEFTYVAQPPIDLSNVVDEPNIADLSDPALDDGSNEVVSSGDDTPTKVLDRRDLHERVERRRKLASRAQHNEARQKKVNAVDERIEKTKEKLKKYKSRLDAAEKQACATSFSDWSLQCNLFFEGGSRQGSIRGSAKQCKPSWLDGDNTPLFPEGSILGSLEQAASSSTRENSYVHVLEDSNWHQEDVRAFVELRLFVKSLRGSVLGQENDLQDLSLKLEGEMDSVGWSVGEVEGGSRTSNFSLKKDARVRFLLRPIEGPRCAHCLEPVTKGQTKSKVTFACACNGVEYCSAACQVAHEPLHRPVCELLGAYAATGTLCTTVARCPLSNTEFTLFYCTPPPTLHSFRILVDAKNPLDSSLELCSDLLIDAELGAKVDFLSTTPPQASGEPKKPTTPPKEQVLDILVNIHQALLFSALEHGNAPLAATALNYLYRWWDNVAVLDRYYEYYLEAFCGHSANRVFVISTLPEYVLDHRPRYELANLSIEYALQSQTSAEFWNRLNQAKSLLSRCYEDFAFGQKAQNIRTILVPEHQRQILHLLAKVFILMATRQPVDVAKNLLEHAVECYKDSVEDDKARNDLYNMGLTCLNLSILYRMFPDDQTRGLADPMKIYALELLKKGEGKSPSDRAPEVIQKALTQMVAAEIDPTKGCTPSEAIAVAGALMSNDHASEELLAAKKTLMTNAEQKPKVPVQGS